MLSFLRRIAVDVTPMRESREFRLIVLGEVVTGLGNQAALVALPFQIYVVSHSAALVGLLGAFELGPLIAVSLVGGAIADRVDRRPVLAAAQVGVLIVAAVLAAVTFTTGKPPVILLLILGGVLAGCSALDPVARSAILPGVLGPERVRSGLAFSYGTQQATGIVGPGLGGLLIAAWGVGGTYLIDAVSCAAMLGAALALGPQRPRGATEHPPVGKAIAEGLRFVVHNRARAGSFAIDLNAMAFGMPRALFAVLSLTVYHAGASGTGLLYAAIAAGGTLSVFTSGWVARANRLGRILIVAVLLWGLAILGAGLVRSIWPAVLLLGAAGWADGVSAVCRSTISQTVTPDHLRGRLSSVFGVVVSGGPRLGDIESGLMAGLVGALNSVVVGGAACVVGVAAVALAFPELVSYEVDAAMRESGMLPADPVEVEPVAAPHGGPSG
jgi:MFS family permease